MTWLDDFVTTCQGQLDDRVREALYARGVTEEQTALYQLGYVDRDLPAYSEAFLQWSGAGEKLADMLVLPLTNTLGHIRGLQFRPVPRGKSTYLDYIEGPSEEAVLFGLAQAMPHIWATQTVYLVEGGFDLFPIQRVCPSVVSTLTARVTLPVVRMLRRLVSHIWVGYDADGPGQKAADHFIQVYGREFRIQKVTYPQVPMLGSEKLTKDPGDLWETWGDQRLQEHLAKFLAPRREWYDA